MRSTLIAFAAIGLATLMILHFSRLREGEEAVRHCAALVEQVQAAKDQYALDHDGQFPASFDQLVPVYLDEIPVCPLGGEMTLGDRDQAASCTALQGDEDAASAE